MKILFVILLVFWVLALFAWLYLIINKKTREKFYYFYPLIAILFFNLAINIVSLMI